MKATTYLSTVKKTIAALMALAASVTAFGQANTSFLLNSPLIHSYSHGALANRNQANNTVGASGVIRTQASWQTAADLDLRFLLPQGVGPYVASGLETFPIKNTLFLDTPERQVWAGQKTVVFSNGQAQSSLDRDVRDGIANAPGGQRIENNYLSGNIPSGTYSFAVENYDNSHYYRNNPSAQATNFNIAVTLSGNGYIIPDNTLPLVASTGYAFGASGSIKDVGAVSPVYSFNFFNPGLDTTHASGIDFFKRFNGNFLPGAYLAMLNVPGMNPAQAPNMVDAMQRMANGQKNQFDSLSVLTNMGEGRLQKEFAKHFAAPDSRHNTAQYIDPKTGQAVTVARSDFIRAMWAMNENKALKQQGDAFMASLPEQTRRDFQAIQNLHGNQHTATELRTADNNFLTNGQVANSVNSTVFRALHSQDAQIAKGIFNDMVAGRTTTNAGAFFDKNQVIGYDGALQNVAYIRNHHGQVLQVTEGQLGTVSALAVEQIQINRVNALIAEQNRIALANQKAKMALSNQSNISNPSVTAYNPYEVCYADGRHLTTISAQTGTSYPLQTGLIWDYYERPTENGKALPVIVGLNATSEKRLTNTIDTVSAALTVFDVLNSPVSPTPDAVFLAGFLQTSKNELKKEIPKVVNTFIRNKEIILFEGKKEAREFFSGEVGIAANRFFRDAAKNAQNFKATVKENGETIFEFFSKARNEGYGKIYRQTVNDAGEILSEVKINTLNGVENLVKGLH